MRRTILIWIALVALCVVGTVHEYPRAVDSLWYVRNVFVAWDASGVTLVPKSIVAEDPEAGAVLHFVLKYRIADPNTIIELRDLVAQYPRNEFFLSQLTGELAVGKNADPNEAVVIADRLLAVAPNNAYAHYLRGWVLLQARRSEDYGNEILRDFEKADQLAEFYLPYGEYQPRVVRLAEEVVLPARRRSHVFSHLQRLLGSNITEMADRQDVDRPSFRQVLSSASHVADRTIDNAYDLESLQAGAQLMEELEQTRLKRLALTDEEARQARRRLGQAVAINELRDPTFLDTFPFGSGPLGLPLMVAWGCALLLPIIAIMAIRTKREISPPIAILQPGHGLRSVPGGFTLVGLLMVLLLHRWGSRGFWVPLLVMFPWFMTWFSWIRYPDRLLRVCITDATHGGRCPWRSRVACLVLWLNGTLLLLMSNSKFFASGHFAGWSQNSGVFVVWSVFCLLLGLSLLNPGLSSTQPRRNLAWAAAVGWALALIAFDVVGAQCRLESQSWSNPLSGYPAIPAATQETYERFIRDGGPPSYIDDERKADALPEYLQYFAAEDMRAFFAKWQAEGRTLSTLQRWGLLHESARDVQPVVRRALAEMQAPSQPPDEPR